MKRNWRKLLSLVLSVMVILTTAGTPVMAAEKKAAPTTVTNCEASGFWTEVLSLGSVSYTHLTLPTTSRV